MSYVEWLISTFLFLIIITQSYLIFQQKIHQIKNDEIEIEFFSLKLLDKIKTYENGIEFVEIPKLKRVDYKELKEFIGLNFNIKIDGEEIFPIILDGEIYSFYLPYLIKNENGNFEIKKITFIFSK